MNCRACLSLLPFAIAVAAPAAAQGRLEVGAKSGLARNTLTSGREFTWTASTNTFAGFLRYALTPRVAVQAEGMVSRRVGVSPISSTVLTMQADYLEAPLLLQWDAVGIGPLSAYLTGGPLVAFRYS